MEGEGGKEREREGEGGRERGGEGRGGKREEGEVKGHNRCEERDGLGVQGAEEEEEERVEDKGSGCVIVGSTCRENDGEWEREKRQQDEGMKKTCTVYIVTMVAKPYCCFN